MKKTFIFDMDGVLVDSEPVYLSIHKHYFQTLGIVVTDEDIHKMTGLTAKHIFTEAKKQYDLRETVEELINKQTDLIISHFESIQNLSHIDGIIDLLESLKAQNIRIGLASSNTRKMIRLLTERTKIASYFDVMMSGEDVQQGKPHPEIFLKTMELLGGKPENSLVIEDSFNGVTAAKRAEMFCVGFRNLNSGNQDISKADMIVDNFSAENIERIIKLSVN